MKHCLSLLLLFCLWLCAISCTQKSQDAIVEMRDLPEILQDDTLRVITMYGPTTFFLYRDNEMGYEYEIVKQLCRDMGVTLQLMLAPDMQTMLQWLMQGKGDVIAYRVPYTQQNKEKVLYTQREYISNQVLVQCFIIRFHCICKKCIHISGLLKVCCLSLRRILSLLFHYQCSQN